MFRFVYELNILTYVFKKNTDIILIQPLTCPHYHTLSYEFIKNVRLSARRNETTWEKLICVCQKLESHIPDVAIVQFAYIRIKLTPKPIKNADCDFLVKDKNRHYANRWTTR